MLADVRKIYINVLNFLGIDDDGRLIFPKINTNKGTRSSIVQRFLCYLAKQTMIVNLARVVKSRLGIGTFGIYKFIIDLNTVKVRRSNIPESVRNDILSQFGEH